MFAVIVDNHLLDVSVVAHDTIYDDSETARQITIGINKANPPHVVAWVKDWPQRDNDNSETVDDNSSCGTMTSSEQE